MQRSPRLTLWFALLCSAAAGCLVALQSRLNGGVSASIGNGFLAGFLSFAGGTVVLTVWILLNPRARSGPRRVFEALRHRALPLWACTGGLCGGFFVLMQGLISPVLGVALFSVGIVAGQVCGGLLVDRAGFGLHGKTRITVTRLFGALLAIAGAGVALAGAGVGVGSRADTSTAPGFAAALILFPVLAGMGVAWQTAVNGRVRAATESAITATYVNFIVGTAVLLLVACISLVMTGWPQSWPTEWWWYLGGPIGVVFIGIAAALTKRVSVLMLSVSNVTGQLIGALVLDAVFPISTGVTLAMVLGAVLAAGAVFVTAFAARRH